MNGARYNPALSLTEIAKSCRMELKLLLEADALPAGSYVVRVQDRTLKITINVKFQIFEKASGRYLRLSSEAMELVAQVEAIALPFFTDEPEPNFKLNVDFHEETRSASRAALNA